MRRVPMILIATAMLSAACSQAGDPSGEPSPLPSETYPRGEAAVLIDTDEGSQLVRVEVADTDAERTRGLMGRTELGDDEGMLFVFFEPTDGGFWMKDTLIPLSIAFVDEKGEIVDILDMQPCEEEPCPIYAPSASYSAALEVNIGSFERWGVETGDLVTVSF